MHKQFFCSHQGSSIGPCSYPPLPILSHMRNAHQLLRFYCFNGMHSSCLMHCLVQVWHLGVMLSYQGLHWQNMYVGPTLHVGDFYLVVTGRSSAALAWIWLEAGWRLQIASEYMALCTLPQMIVEHFFETITSDMD